MARTNKSRKTKMEKQIKQETAEKRREKADQTLIRTSRGGGKFRKGASQKGVKKK